MIGAGSALQITIIIPKNEWGYTLLGRSDRSLLVIPNWSISWIPLLANKCPGLWPNRKLLKHFKCLGGLPAVSPPPPKLAVYLRHSQELGRERRGRREGLETATLNNISSAKVFLRLVPFFLCPHNALRWRKKKEKRKENSTGQTWMRMRNAG